MLNTISEGERSKGKQFNNRNNIINAANLTHQNLGSFILRQSMFGESTDGNVSGETPEKIQYALLQGSQDLSGAAEYLLNGVMDNKGQMKTNVELGLYRTLYVC